MGEISLDQEDEDAVAQLSEGHFKHLSAVSLRTRLECATTRHRWQADTPLRRQHRCTISGHLPSATPPATMPYTPPSSAFTAVDVPHFNRPTQGNLSSPVPHRNRSAMLNFSTERGPGAHKPLRGLPRRVKSSAPPSAVALSTASTLDASVPRSMAAIPIIPPERSSSRERRAKFSVGDDDSSESASTSPKGSPSTENGPVLKIGELDPDLTPTPTPQPAWATGTPPRASPPLAKSLSIDTSTAYTTAEDDKAVPFPLLSPEPVATGPPTRKAAVIPRGALSHFTSSFANTSADDVDAPATMIRSASSSMIPPSPSLGSPRHLSGPQKNLNGSGHGRSASMADARLDKFGRHSPTESGTCTPVIRKSNGQPLKPSLKSSLSSPNIASMGGPRPIAKSAPATPRVHFKELGLESVVLFDKGARPVAVSGEYGGADDTETETETETTRGYPFPRVPSESPLVRLAPTTSQLALQPPPHSHVHLQYLALPPVRPPRLHGTVLVRNVAFGKSVVVRYTTDNWETASEIMAAYSASLPPGIYPGAGDASWDKFTFTIKLDDIERSLPNRTLFCVVRYDAHGVGEWWDNNNSQNYRVEFERPAEGSGATKPGDQSSAPKPFAPPQFTYSDASLPAPAPVSAPPAPLTKPRSFSTSVVTPPPPIKAPPPVSCGPSPHVLHLRLSNYVSPMANVPKAPLPGKPAEKRPVEKKEEERISPPSSPEHLKRELGLLTSDFGADFQAENRNVFVPSPEVAPLKMPATLTPPDSAHNSPSPSPPMIRKPLPPHSLLSQPQDNGLLSPSSSPSTSMLITSPSSPSETPAVVETVDTKDKDGDVSPSEALLEQSYPELLNRFCFHQSSRSGTPYSSSSAPMLGVLGMSNGYLVASPKSSRDGSPAGSGNNSPPTTSKNGMPRGGSFVLGTPGATFNKWNAPSGLAGL
ncbi:hypothetical protein FS749_004021 [Ceratobasidium sp. UAMH 11750]|nr:hypothetical protein FS749_004021 [Ceratobasidium sp. UAMH 11750]